MPTIKHLFGLHLTVRSTTDKINAALNWLLDKISVQNETIHVAGEDVAGLQTDSGGWGDDLSFYQTLNALAHLDLPQAESQLERAFERLYENQNRDGTWSRSEPEWNTFLAIHAIKNKGS